MHDAHDSGLHTNDVGAGVALSRLVDVPRDEFAEKWWGRSALLARSVDSRRFADLFSSAAVDELISRRGLRTPFLRVAKNGTTLAESRFTRSAGVGATIGDQLDDTALWRALADGATLVLQALQRTWDPIGTFCAALSEELAHPVQANAYITPSQNRGFDDHYDVHDVFVLQVRGTKRWIIHEPVLLDPLRDQPWADRRDEVARAAAEPAVIDAVLEPGDCLYLPRGWLHAAEALGELSIHVTLGIHAWTRFALAEELMKAALAGLKTDPTARASLPVGFDEPVDEITAVREQLTEALRQVDIAAALRVSRRAQARPGPLGPLAQLDAVADLGSLSTIVLRPALSGFLDGRRLQSRVGWLDLDETELEGVRTLLERGFVDIHAIGAALAERLLRAGVAVPGPARQ